MNPHEFCSEHDEFPELFTVLECLPPANLDRSEAIFAQTRIVLTRRRWFRRVRLVATLTGCYLVGVCSGWVLKPAPVELSGVQETEGQTQVVQVKQLAVSPDSRKSSVKPGVTQAISSAGDKTKSPSPSNAIIQDEAVSIKKGKPVNSDVAGTPPRTSPFESLRRAGDRQLLERGDFRRAIEFYQRALSHASEDELRVEIHRDSWLLISLKQSHIEELKHVRKPPV